MRRETVQELQTRGVLLVEDGNHGENRPLRHEFATDGVAFIRAADMTSGVVDFSSAERITAIADSRIRKGRGVSGDIIVSHKGTVGKVARVPRDAPRFVCSPQTTFYRSLDPRALDQDYLYYFLQSEDFQSQLRARQGETDMAPYVSLTSQRGLAIALPAIEEQRRIAGILKALDGLIEVNRRLIGQNAELLSALHSRALAESVSVTAVPLFDVFDVDFGAAFRGDSFAPAGVGMPLLRIRDLKTFRSDVWTTERVKGDVIVGAGDVVVGMDAEFRPTYWLGDNSLLNQRVCRIRPKLGSISFAREALVAPMAFIEGHKTGTTVSHLNKSDLAESKISVPDASALAWFDSASEPLRLALVGLYRENLQLAAARDELLPLLLSGRVAVREVAT